MRCWKGPPCVISKWDRDRSEWLRRAESLQVEMACSWKGEVSRTSVQLKFPSSPQVARSSVCGALPKCQTYIVFFFFFTVIINTGYLFHLTVIVFGHYGHLEWGQTNVKETMMRVSCRFISHCCRHNRSVYWDQVLHTNCLRRRKTSNPQVITATWKQFLEDFFHWMQQKITRGVVFTFPPLKSQTFFGAGVAALLLSTPLSTNGWTQRVHFCGGRWKSLLWNGSKLKYGCRNPGESQNHPNG